MMLRIGILGTGKVALDHAKAISSLGHQIVAGCTQSSNSENWGNFSAIYPDAEFVPLPDLLMREDIDAYTVGLSWFAMPEWLPQLLAHPKPMLLEKPIGINSRDIDAAIASAENCLENKIVGFNRRFYKPVAELKNRLSKGGLVSTKITNSENLKNLVDRWGREILPHIISYSSCHILDLAQYLLGPLSVQSSIRSAVIGYEPFENIHSLLTTKEGRAVQLSIKENDPIAVGITCHFNDGTTWQLGPIEQLSVFEGYDIELPTLETPIKKYLPKKTHGSYVDTSQRPGFLEQFEAFLNDPIDCEPAARPSDSLSLQILIENLKEAA
jgi:predicted dehydrogenase